MGEISGGKPGSSCLMLFRCAGKRWGRGRDIFVSRRTRPPLGPQNQFSKTGARRGRYAECWGREGGGVWVEAASASASQSNEVEWRYHSFHVSSLALFQFIALVSRIRISCIVFVPPCFLFRLFFSGGEPRGVPDRRSPLAVDPIPYCMFFRAQGEVDSS